MSLTTAVWTWTLYYITTYRMINWRLLWFYFLHTPVEMLCLLSYLGCLIDYCELGLASIFWEKR